jgi:hypothetical protein
MFFIARERFLLLPESGLELKQQTFLQIPGTGTGRVELLNTRQDSVNFFLVGRDIPAEEEDHQPWPTVRAAYSRRRQ